VARSQVPRLTAGVRATLQHNAHAHACCMKRVYLHEPAVAGRHHWPVSAVAAGAGKIEDSVGHFVSRSESPSAVSFSMTCLITSSR